MENNIQSDVERFVINHIAEIENELFDARGERSFDFEIDGYKNTDDLLIYHASADVHDIVSMPQYTGEDYYYTEQTMTYSLHIDGAEYYFDSEDEQGDIYTEEDFEKFNEDNEYRTTTREIS